MKNLRLPLIIAALVIPSLAVAATVDNSNIISADMSGSDLDSLPVDIQDEDEGSFTRPNQIEDNAIQTQSYSDEILDSTPSNPNVMNDSDSHDDSDTLHDPRNTTNNMATQRSPMLEPDPNNEAPIAQAPNGQLSNTEQDATISNRALANNTAQRLTPERQMAEENYNSNVTPTITRSTTAFDSVEKKKDARGELLATQPAEIQLNENRRVVVR